MSCKMCVGDQKAQFKNSLENYMTTRTHTLAVEGTNCKITLRTPEGAMAGDLLAARVLEVMAQVKKANKVTTAAATRAAYARRTDKRLYPKFNEGDTTADYVRAYTMLNARTTGHGLRVGNYLSITDIQREEAWIKSFYEPLSTARQFTPVDEVEAELELEAA